MQQHFVFEVLEVMSSEELKELQLFLESPYFNRNFNAPYLLKLKSIFDEYVATDDSNLLERTALYKSIFPDHEYVEGKLDKLFSEFKKLLQHFLVVQLTLEEQREDQQLLTLAEALRHRQLEKRYHQHLGKVKKNLDASAAVSVSVDHLRLKYELELEEHRWQGVFNKAKGNLNIPQVLKALDEYYFTIKTEFLNNLLHQQRLTNLDEAARQLLAAPWTVDTQWLEANPYLHINYKIYELFKKPANSVEEFNELLKLLKLHEARIAPNELRGLYTYVRNFCAYLIDFQKLDELKKVLHDIQKDNLMRGYFYYEDKILAISFLSIVQTAIHVGELDWAKSFIETHQDRILGGPEEQEAYQICKAICLFSEQKFEEALEHIPFGNTYSFFHLLARRLELKVYYELDSELLPYKIDAFKMFISRAGKKDLAHGRYEIHVNFINFLRQLSLIPRFRDKAKSEKMIQKISEKKLVSERTWLLEKAREIGEQKR